MIKANELRIGNWIYSDYVKMPYKVSGYGIGVVERSPENHSPIPLRAEILHSIEGSVSGYTSDPQQPNPSLSYMIGDVCINQPRELDNYFYYFAGDVDIEIKSLHQLQNLYFALTGTELNIEL